jgi:hypothetical protein
MHPRSNVHFPVYLNSLSILESQVQLTNWFGTKTALAQLFSTTWNGLELSNYTNLDQGLGNVG